MAGASPAPVCCIHVSFQCLIVFYSPPSHMSLRPPHHHLVTIIQAERLKEGGVSDFHRKEDDFSMTQARLRGELRLQAGRAKYVDIIAHNLESQEAAMRPEMKPWKIFESMSFSELEDVRRDIEAVAPAGKSLSLLAARRPTYSSLPLAQALTRSSGTTCLSSATIKSPS